MSKFYSLLFVSLSSLIIASCGGGSDKTEITLGGEDVEIEAGGDYRCALATDSSIFFDTPETVPPADFSKKSGLNLERYFYFITTDDSDKPEEERRNKYILKYEKNYIVDLSNGFEVTDFEPATVQSLLDSWYYIGERYEENKQTVISSNSEWDDDIPRYAFSPAGFINRVGESLPSTFVHFADLGDTVSYTNTKASAALLQEFCTIHKNFVPEQLISKYGSGGGDADIIVLECTSRVLFDPDSTTGDQLFTGIKSKTYLAKDIGIVSDLTDSYQTLIVDTQETQKRCLQTYSELVETKLVPRTYTPSLGNIVP